MSQIKSLNRRLISAILVLIMMVTSLIGTTFAWFTDSVTSGNNIITTGRLDVELYWSKTFGGSWNQVGAAGNEPIFTNDKWEPGYTEVRYIKVANEGNLAFKYAMSIVPVGEVGELAKVIDVYYITDPTEDSVKRNNLDTLTPAGKLSDVINSTGAEGVLLPEGEEHATYRSGETVFAMVLKLPENVGNEYMEKSVGDSFSVRLMATQFNTETDSFDTDYDKDVAFPPFEDDKRVVYNLENGQIPAGGITFGDAEQGINATVPDNVALEEGATKLTLTVDKLDETKSNVVLDANEIILPLNVHIDGISETNTAPIVIDLGPIAPKGLNIGNYTLYHVEDGVTQTMTLVASAAELNAHNTFTYDAVTGNVSVAMATFSEVAVVADTENKWEGNRDYSWYTNAVAALDGGAATEYVIANADQLAAFGAIVGGMDGQTQDSFAGKTVKLISDINLGDKESENNPDIIFYPIGYYNSEGTYERTNTAITSGLRNFEGTFDGNGHTVSNFYQNTWEMKGDHDWYSPEEQYYRDGMGLFGRIYEGTVKNLTVKNFSSDGEIATTGTIAAYADGATFENIAVFDCNPRVYNIGNGGIVGCVGWYAKEADLKTTFKNITVDNSNKISALWGSYDVACGGIVGQYYPTSGQTSAGQPANAGIHFENCHVSAQMDVYNDVCANYQYYAYRYTGMMIGSIRENLPADENGHVYPNMNGITAKDCTVHFGDWNDYYYCELVANSLASYTHDHQMSRLTQVASVNVANKTVTDLDGKTTAIPTSGRVNYVVVKAKDANGAWIHGDGHDYAECYHFVNGVQHFHDVADSDNPNPTETVNGVEGVLKEDKQLIYREFNQLFTGYGWGVTSKGIGDLDGVTILDREVGNSYVKFEKIEDASDTYMNGKPISIGSIFGAAEIDDEKLSILNPSVSVTVSPVGDESTVSAVYVANTTDWTQGTLTFSGNGTATITITDYYFCTPTTITVTIEEKASVEKFEVKLNNGDFLHRVGNQNAVKLDSLFSNIDGETIGTVSVTVEALNGTSASGTYTSNATWTNGTIQFSGTGVVKVTITDNDYCTPTELLLEVVDATNITSATGTTSGGNFVLLCDVNTNTYVNYWNCTLYGNGFTYSLKGAPTNYSSSQGKGIIIAKNAVLDNLVIIGDIYTGYGAYTNNDYYNTAIDVNGDTTIQNCYIANCAAPVRARNNLTITNSTLYGGAVGNLIIESGTVTLEDVTTANYDDGRAVVGMGIVIHSDATEAAKLVINGTLTQYNFISESKVPTDTYAKNLHTVMFGDSCSKYHFGTSPNRYVNAGIVSLTAVFNSEDITDNANTGYVGTAVTLSGVDGYVYTQPNTLGSVYNKELEYEPTTQGTVPPSYSFDYTNENYVAKTDGSNDYCYQENGKVNISMDDGETFNWDTSILTIGKGITTYTVTMNGTDYTGKSIAFNTAGDYEVVYTYTDDNNYRLGENGSIVTYSVTYSKTVEITVAVVEATTKHAEFTFGSSNTASTTVTVGNSTYVMPNVSATSSTIGSTTVSGQTIYYPIVEIVMSDGKTSHTSGWYAYFPVFSGAVTITDYADNGTGDQMTPYNSSTTTMPGGLSVVDDPKTLFKYQSGSNAGETPVVKNNILVYSSAKIEAKRDEYNTVVQYSYTDNAGATYYYYIGYHAPAQSYTSCVTADTLVTLADGTQKRIDEVTYADKLLVWDFFKGELTAVSPAIIFDHGYGNNTVIELNFSDGTTVNVVNLHQFYDADLGEFVSIDADTVADYVGHKFAKNGANGFEFVTLDSYNVTEEYCEAWGIISAEHYNIFVNDMLSTDFMLEDYALFNYFTVGSDMKFDEEAMNADIEKYGLYTYEDFADVLTYEQFIAFNVQYFKIAVAKGDYTYEGILNLIEIYLNK